MPKALILIADGSEEIEFVTPYDGTFNKVSSHHTPKLLKGTCRSTGLSSDRLSYNIQFDDNRAHFLVVAPMLSS